MRTLLIAAAALFVSVTITAAIWGWYEGLHDCGVSHAEAESEPNWVLELCARAGHAPAQAWLGMMYWSDAGNEESWRFPSLSDDELDARGRHWMELAAENGSAIAQNELGLAYLDGKFGLPQDFRLARHWLEAATQGGDEIAPVNLARMHLAGLGVLQSEGNAEAMLRLSADRGYFEGRCSLAALLERRGVAANRTEIEFLRRPRDESGYQRVCTDNDLIRGLGLSDHQPEAP